MNLNSQWIKHESILWVMFDSTKPLHKPMLACYQFDSWGQNSEILIIHLFSCKQIIWDATSKILFCLKVLDPNVLIISKIEMQLNISQSPISKEQVSNLMM